MRVKGAKSFLSASLAGSDFDGKNSKQNEGAKQQWNIHTLKQTHTAYNIGVLRKRQKGKKKKQNLFLSLHFCIHKQATGKTKQKRNRQTLQLTPTHSQADGSKTKTTTKLILKKSKKN